MLLTSMYIVHINPICKPSPFTITFRSDQDIISTHHTFAHLSCLIKSPIFQSIAPLQAHSIFHVLELIPKLHSDAIILESEKFLSKSVTTRAFPFRFQERDNRLSPGKELVSNTPDTCWGVPLSDSGRVPNRTWSERAMKSLRHLFSQINSNSPSQERKINPSRLRYARIFPW